MKTLKELVFEEIKKNGETNPTHIGFIIRVFRDDFATATYEQVRDCFTELLNEGKIQKVNEINYKVAEEA